MKYYVNYKKYMMRNTMEVQIKASCQHEESEYTYHDDSFDVVGS